MREQLGAGVASRRTRCGGGPGRLERTAVVYHHRGAYLRSLAMAYHARLGARSRYLWTLPMFRCNGWCFTWGRLGVPSVCRGQPQSAATLRGMPHSAQCGIVAAVEPMAPARTPHLRAEQRRLGLAGGRPAGAVRVPALSHSSSYPACVRWPSSTSEPTSAPTLRSRS